jgi:dTDP-D-glucose 4,6-dehydratase
LDFVYTNVIGTVNLLNVAKDFWKDDLINKNSQNKNSSSKKNHLFYTNPINQMPALLSWQS